MRAAAAEISSIGLEERRVEELNFRACLFTNLARDHLDYHGTIENYFAAKLRLFTELLAEERRCGRGRGGERRRPVRTARAAVGARAQAQLWTWTASCDVHPVSFSTGTRRNSRGARRRWQASGDLLAAARRINLLNILGASAVSVALGIDDGCGGRTGVRRCPGAPGRLEAVAGPAGVKVLVDYAHKPDALAGGARALRALSPRRLICVFGCGGDRDRGKRPIMGEIAGRLADLPILTSDNPRTEDPLQIIAEVEDGLQQTALKRIDRKASAGGGRLPGRARSARGDRAGARSRSAGDIVVIAGKGHEDYQLVGGRRLDFDDRKVVRELTAASIDKGAERPPGTAN